MQQKKVLNNFKSLIFPIKDKTPTPEREPTPKPAPEPLLKPASEPAPATEPIKHKTSKLKFRIN